MTVLEGKQIEKWYPRLFRTALRLTGSTDDASDLTQQAFCKAIQSRHTFAGRGLPTTWLHRILINCVRDHLRRKTTRRTQSFDEWDMVPVDKSEGSAERMEKDEKMKALRTAIEELSQPVRIAFVVTVIDGYSYREAAEILDVPVGTVASRVNLARRELCQTMRNAFPEA